MVIQKLISSVMFIQMHLYCNDLVSQILYYANISYPIMCWVYHKMNITSVYVTFKAMFNNTKDMASGKVSIGSWNTNMKPREWHKWIHLQPWSPEVLMCDQAHMVNSNIHVWMVFNDQMAAIKVSICYKYSFSACYRTAILMYWQEPHLLGFHDIDIYVGSTQSHKSCLHE